jgi:hypothetical protein
MKNNKIMNPPDDRVHVCGLIDSADGDAHEVACYLVPLTDAFVTALQLLHDSSDHVCIIDDENYTRLEHTYTSLAPYSINISAGGYIS